MPSPYSSCVSAPNHAAYYQMITRGGKRHLYDLV
jgi:hypothetical protein